MSYLSMFIKRICPFSFFTRSLDHEGEGLSGTKGGGDEPGVWVEFGNKDGREVGAEK